MPRIFKKKKMEVTQALWLRRDPGECTSGFCVHSSILSHANLGCNRCYMGRNKRGALGLIWITETHRKLRASFSFNSLQALLLGWLLNSNKNAWFYFHFLPFPSSSPWWWFSRGFTDREAIATLSTYTGFLAVYKTFSYGPLQSSQEPCQQQLRLLVDIQNDWVLLQK